MFKWGLRFRKKIKVITSEYNVLLVVQTRQLIDNTIDRIIQFIITDLWGRLRICRYIFMDCQHNQSIQSTVDPKFSFKTTPPSRDYATGDYTYYYYCGYFSFVR